MSKVFVCTDCGLSNFQSSSEIRAHIRQVHSPKAKCPICYINFHSIKRFTKHCWEEHQIDNYRFHNDLLDFRTWVKKQYVVHDPYNYEIPVKQVNFECCQYITELLVC